MAFWYSLSSRPDNSRRHLTQKLVPGSLFEGLVEATPREKDEMKAMIKRTMSTVNIKEIKKVKNSFLEAMYLLKKEEYRCRYQSVTEKVLIHITGVSNVLPIIRNNFDWRKIKRGKFGLGTSFSDDAEYANKYANQNIGYERAVIVTKVLVSRTTFGRSEITIPPRNFDTATGNRSKVYVKFCDHEVLPQFVIYYNRNVSSAQQPEHCIVA